MNRSLLPQRWEPELCPVNATLKAKIAPKVHRRQMLTNGFLFLVGLLHEFCLLFGPAERVGAGCGFCYDGTLFAVWQNVAGGPLESTVVHFDAGLAVCRHHGFGFCHRASRR